MAVWQQLFYVSNCISQFVLVRVGGFLTCQPIFKFFEYIPMKRIAFKMQLNRGCEAEYQKRHDELWPELKELLKSTGICDYAIFLDETTNALFGIFKMEDAQLLDDLPQHPVMQKWWLYMKDIMESNPDNSPVSIPLKQVFYLP